MRYYNNVALVDCLSENAFLPLHVGTFVVGSACVGRRGNCRYTSERLSSRFGVRRKGGGVRGVGRVGREEGGAGGGGDEGVSHPVLTCRFPVSFVAACLWLFYSLACLLACLLVCLFSLAWGGHHCPKLSALCRYQNVARGLL